MADTDTIDVITSLRTLRDQCAEYFARPIDIPAVAQKLDLESRKGDPVRQFKHIHQSCLMMALDFETVCKMRVLLLLDGYLALHDAKAGLPIYAVTRSAIELHGLVLNVSDRLKGYATGDLKDWRSRGEGFFSYLVRARNGTRDKEMVAKLTSLGVSKGALEPIHSKDCEAALFNRKEYQKDRALYEKLCDFVHTNSQGYYVGSPGWFMDNLVAYGKATFMTAKSGPVNRYHYPAEDKFHEAISVTAEAMFRHCSGIILAMNNFQETPFSPGEVKEHTGNPLGMATLGASSITSAPNPYSGKLIGRNDPCPCGSGRKYKHCHLN